MRWKSLITLGVFLSLLFAHSASLLASHVHDACDSAASCALCSFAATVADLDTRPAPVPIVSTEGKLPYTDEDHAPAFQEQAANGPRAPPTQLS
jgi:hypothetical protein